MKFIILKIIGVIILPILAQAQIPEGLWKTACVQGLQKQQQITPTSVQMNESFYLDRNCQSPSFEFITKGLISYPSSEESLIDFIYTQIELKIFHPGVVQDFNERQVCGFTDWEIAVSKDITGKQCALFNLKKPSQIPVSGTQKFGIYKVENNQLFYGKLSKEHDSSVPDKRPIEFDTFSYSLSLF